MSARLEAALRVVRTVADRPDPEEPIGSGAVAVALEISPTSASRLCAELHGLGLLERGGAYGAYRLGLRAVALSGRAAAGSARYVRQALTIAAQQTGETACLAAGADGGLRVVGSVGSEWTLHASADVGASIRSDSAIAEVLRSITTTSTASAPELAETTGRKVVEVAAPVHNPSGEVVAAVAVRLPTNRSARGAPRARRAVQAARRSIEDALLADERATHRRADAPEHEQTTESRAQGRAHTHAVGSTDRPTPRPGGSAGLPQVAHHPTTHQGSPRAASASTLTAAALVLDQVAERPDTTAGLAGRTGLRPDRVQRLVDAAVHAGLVRADPSGMHELSWGVHGWHRATTATVLAVQGRALVAAAAAETATFGFVTVLKGIRSLTVVEELDAAERGLVMMPWLNRPHPVIGSDGGPSLVADFTPEFLGPLLRKRHAAAELETLFTQMRTVRRDGVLSIESIEEAGLISTSAPVRDASGSIVAAACLTGETDAVRGRVDAVAARTKALAGALSAALGWPG